MDRLSRVLLFAGCGCFLFAFLLSGLYPWMATGGSEPEAGFAELAEHVSPDFKQLKELYPVVFAQAFPQAAPALTALELAGVPADDPRRTQSDAAWRAAYADALQRGRDAYVADGCWHCHSQYVRPVANEELRWGPVLPAANDNNALQRPVLWGTRRVGPDLTHEGGLRSDDWHVAHLWDPQSTSPGSVMPRYTWFFRDGWQVRRRIDPDIAEREGLDPATSYPVPGVHATQAEAQAALERHAASLPSSLTAEKSRLFVDRGREPDARGLALVSYLQWLGTWEPPVPQAAKAGAP
jgi:cbb3-type cytochrome c oxidase subunit II